MIALIDNYDSFTNNLYHQIIRLTGSAPLIIHNDEPLPEGTFEAIIISPGPGSPENPADMGTSMDAIRRAMDPHNPIPILGVCLGHQAIAYYCGARIAHAPQPMHGIIDEIHGDYGTHSVMRYHSLAVYDCPPELHISAYSSDNVIMAFEHTSLPAYGVQFHPESVGSASGDFFLSYFLDKVEKFWAQNTQVIIKEGIYPAKDYIPAHNPVFYLQDENYAILGLPEPDAPAHTQPGVSITPSALANLNLESLPFSLGWMGLCTYEGHSQWFPIYRSIIFDYAHNRTIFFSLGKNTWDEEELNALQLSTDQDPPFPSELIEELHSLEPRDSAKNYIEAIKTAQEYIRDGHSYEICLTTAFENKASQWSTDQLFAAFVHMRKKNPTPFSAFLHLGEDTILSFSPEEFIRINHTETGRIARSRPIKGTHPAEWDPEKLRTGIKEQAENLMIVDLVRHDLGSISYPDGVRADNILEVETHGRVHQLMSTISAQVRPEVNNFDIFCAAFPPGSMTGAPKKRTMEIIESLETAPRGIYSGYIGYIDSRGNAATSVVIRTLIHQPHPQEEGYRWHYGVGGAITALSEPEKEWEEILLKTRTLHSL